MTTNGVKPITVTIAAARRLSGLGATTLWKLIKEKKLEVVKVGRRTLIVYETLERLLAPTGGDLTSAKVTDARPDQDITVLAGGL